MLEQIELKAVIDAISVPVMVIDVNEERRYRHLMVNKAAETYYDISNEEYSRDFMDELNTEDPHRQRQRNRAIAAYNRCVERKQAIEVEFSYRKPNKEVTWARHSCVPVFDEQGTVRRIMVTSLDITDLVKSQRHLEDVLTKTLSGFVTICAGCKDIRHEGSWQSIEKYADEQLDFQQFSHGLCASCERKFYQEN